MKTNWENLSRKLGVLKEDGSELYTGQSMQALEEILGDEWIKDSIDCFIDGRKGNELAIKTIRRIGSNKAADYAFSIFNENKETDIQKASLALWAINEIRMPKCIDFAEIAMKNQHFSAIAFGIVRNLIFDNCLAFEEQKLNEILNKFDLSFKEDVAILKTFITNEFRKYENKN